MQIRKFFSEKNNCMDLAVCIINLLVSVRVIGLIIGRVAVFRSAANNPL